MSKYGTMKKTLIFLVTITIAALPGKAYSALDNDYPTEVIADYVFACMASNGQTSVVLKKCSCSIDVIASQLTYEKYVDAETILRMRLISGEKGAVFTTGQVFKEKVAVLKRAQAEAEILCF